MPSDAMFTPPVGYTPSIVNDNDEGSCPFCHDVLIEGCCNGCNDRYSANDDEDVFFYERGLDNE